jgi:hypothetical protein
MEREGTGPGIRKLGSGFGDGRTAGEVSLSGMAGSAKGGCRRQGFVVRRHHVRMRLGHRCWRGGATLASGDKDL